jgi:hypothetical protein
VLQSSIQGQARNEYGEAGQQQYGSGKGKIASVREAGAALLQAGTKLDLEKEGLRDEVGLDLAYHISILGIALKLQPHTCYYSTMNLVMCTP